MARKVLTFTVVYEKDPETGDICASFPALDLATHGPTLKKARALAREALELHLEGMLAENLLIPADVIKTEPITVEVGERAKEKAKA
jgi:predicted RNase H-like HicB family nuclease